MSSRCRKFNVAPREVLEVECKGSDRAELVLPTLRSAECLLPWSGVRAAQRKCNFEPASAHKIIQRISTHFERHPRHSLRSAPFTGRHNVKNATKTNSACYRIFV